MSESSGLGRLDLYGKMVAEKIHGAGEWMYSVGRIGCK